MRNFSVSCPEKNTILFLCDFDEQFIESKNLTNELTKINEGSFSTVYSFMDKYAIKIMKNNYCKYLDNISEISILNGLKSEYIVKSYGVFLLNNNLCLIMENIPKNLCNYVFTNDSEKIDVIKQLCKGLQFLHDNLFLHLDLTSNNILIKVENNKPKILLCDFSHSCKTFDLTVVSISHRISPNYRPYENLKGSLLYSDKSDIWSLGILIYEIINETSIQKDLLNITVGEEYNSEMSMIIFIERLLAWNKWPLNLQIDNLNYTNFLNIDINNRESLSDLVIRSNESCKRFSYNISYAWRPNDLHLYQIKTEKLYLEILNLYDKKTLSRIFEDNSYLYHFCFMVLYCLYNYPDITISSFESFQIVFMFKIMSVLNFSFIQNDF